MESILACVEFSDKVINDYPHEIVTRGMLRRWYKESNRWACNQTKPVTRTYKLTCLK